MGYRIVYERSEDGWSAYVPELPGCTSAGRTKSEVEESILEAIELHLEVMAKSNT